MYYGAACIKMRWMGKFCRHFEGWISFLVKRRWIDDDAMGERMRDRALRTEVAVLCTLIEEVGDDESGVRAKTTTSSKILHNGLDQGSS